MTAAKIAYRAPGSPVRQLWWNDPNVWQGPVGRWWVPRVAYWDTGAIPSPWRSGPVDPLYFLYKSGSQFLPSVEDPVRSQLRGYQWAGNYRQPHFDPLLLYKGQAAAPPLAPLREAAQLVTMPMQNELGYQMVFVRDNGVPIGATPASTPNYVAAGPPIIGPMSLVQPIIRGEQIGVGSRPMIPNPGAARAGVCDGHGFVQGAGPCMPPYPVCPWGFTDGTGEWPPQCAPPQTEVYGMDVGGWPVYGRAPTHPTIFPPTFPLTGYPLVGVADPTPQPWPPRIDLPLGESSDPQAPPPRAQEQPRQADARAQANPRHPAGSPISWVRGPLEAGRVTNPPTGGIGARVATATRTGARAGRAHSVPRLPSQAMRVVATVPPTAAGLPWVVLQQWLLAAEGYPATCPSSCTLVKWSDGHWACECEGQAPVWLSDGLSSALSRRVAQIARSEGKTDEQFLAEKGALPRSFPNRPVPPRSAGVQVLPLGHVSAAREGNPSWFLGGVLTVGAGAAAYLCWPRTVHLEEKAVGEQKLEYVIREHRCRSEEPYEASVTTRQPGLQDFVEKRTFAELPAAYAYLAVRGGSTAPVVNPSHVVRRTRVSMQREPNPVWPWALGAAALVGVGAAAARCRAKDVRTQKVDLLAGASMTKSLRYEGCFKDAPYVATLRVTHPGVDVDKEVSVERYDTEEEALAALFGVPDALPLEQSDAEEDEPYTPKIPAIPNPVLPWALGAGALALGAAGTAAYLHCRPRTYFERFEDLADTIEWERHFDGCFSKKPWRATFRLRRSPSGEVLVEEIRYFSTEIEADAYLKSTRSQMDART